MTISTVVFNRVTSSLGKGEDIIRSYKAAQWTTCGFALLASVISLLVFRGVGVPGHRKAQDPPERDEERLSHEGEKLGEEKTAEQ